MNLISYVKCKFEINQLLISDDTTVDEWKEIGRELSFINGSVQVWIGDWIGFGKKRGFYTDSKVYDELEEITGLERQTLQVYKSVCENVSSLIRIKDLDFSHFRETWIKKYDIKEAKNKSYTTISVAVPIDDLRNACSISAIIRLNEKEDIKKITRLNPVNQLDLF